MGALSPVVVRRVAYALVFTGVVVLILGTVLSDYIDGYLNEKADEQVTVYPPNVNKERYDNWKNNYNPDEHPPEYYEFYIWNFTNLEQVLADSSVKPVLNEVGPYTYRIYWEKFDTEFSLNEDFVSFHRYRYYVFEPELSNGLSDQDVFKVLNLGYLSLFYKVGPRLATASTPPYIDLTVEQLVFNYTVTAIVPGPQPVVVEVPINLFYNCTSKEACAGKYPFRGQYTGVNYKDQVTNLDLWEGDTYLRNCYKDKHKISGTEKRQFKRNLKKEDSIVVWDDDAYRQVKLNYYREKTVKGIKLNEYRIAPETFQKSDFFLYDGPDGMFNVTAVNVIKYAIGPIEGPPIPVFISRAHFLYANETLSNAVDGMKPDAEKHDTYLAIEPFLGTMMDGARRAQVNVKLQKSFFLPGSEYQNLPEIYMPHLWFTERGAINDKLANEFKDQVYFAQDARDALFLVGVIVGPILIAFGAAVLFYQYRKDVFGERSGHTSSHHYAQVVTSPY